MMKSTKPLYQDYNPDELLRVYTYYRTLLGSLLLLMFYGHVADRVFGQDHPDLFWYTAITYTALNAVTLVVLMRISFSPSQRQLFALLMVDIVSIILIVHSSGGAGSPLSYLLLIAAAASGMLLKLRLAIFLAALASIGIISESLYRAATGTISDEANVFFTSGILGAFIFISAIIFQYLAVKIRASTNEARKQSRQALQAQQLSQQIVERMRTGIIVLDQNNGISLFNQAAAKLLAVDTATNPTLSQLPDLESKVLHWQKTQQNFAPLLYNVAHSNDEIKINFAKLTPGEDTNTLIFLEDNRAITQHAQKLKLASLGRLTASIAHEIRNPLGAISHASQLLAEDNTMPAADLRLVEIINSHTKRVNQIIENVLQLSRRRISEPQVLQIDEWLQKFINDYNQSKSSRLPMIDYLSHSSLMARFDPSQLHQVLTNLCDNGLRYSKPAEHCSPLVIETGTHNQHPFINVIDYGEGVTPDNIEHLFEPFFTTENTGSGLGLYICKELCEANQSLISYTRTANGLSCFQIQFAHPHKAW